ncbi:MAG: hypothetical protein V4628_11490 [Pseudomonadota bacterium]
MKIYRRPGFLKLPDGILFCIGKPWHWQEPQIKTRTHATNDFDTLALSDIEWNGSEDLLNKQEEMLETGKSYPIDLDSSMRDGCFDNEQIFLVYEADDIKALIATLGQCTYPPG